MTWRYAVRRLVARPGFTADPLTFAAMAAVFFAIAALASWAPAWRAASVDLTVALRRE